MANEARGEQDLGDLAFSEVESFIASRVWKILVADALARTQELHAHLETSDPYVEPGKISRAQGHIQGLDWLIDRPSQLLQQIEYERKMKEKREEREEDGTDGTES